MIQSLIDVLLNLVIAAVPIILAITLPVAAQGWMANRCGDTTARAWRRLTFNPLPHIDQIGTLAVPFVCFVFSQVTHSPLLLMGWAKPLPLRDSNLRRPRTDGRWVALANPGANLVMALAWAVLLDALLRVAPPVDPYTLAGILGRMAQYGERVNVVFAAIALIPVPPMPGGRVLVSFLKYRQAAALQQLEPHALWIVLLVLFSGLINVLLLPLAWLVQVLAALLTGF